MANTSADSSSGASVYDLAPSPGDRPLPRLCKLILGEAMTSGASGVRLRPEAATPTPLLPTIIEFRISGEWTKVMGIPLMVTTPLIDYLRQVASVNPEGPSPQAGAMRIRWQGRDASARVTIESVESGLPDVTIELADALVA